MKNVLIPTDFSQDSQEAVRLALEFLRQLPVPGHVTLLNTYVIHQKDPALALSLNDNLRERSRAGLAGALEKAQQQVKGCAITLETISKMGSLRNVMGQLLREQTYDLVVMGKRHGKHVQQVSDLLKGHGGCSLLVTFAGRAAS